MLFLLFFYSGISGIYIADMIIFTEKIACFIGVVYIDRRSGNRMNITASGIHTGMNLHTMIRKPSFSSVDFAIIDTTGVIVIEYKYNVEDLLQGINSSMADALVSVQIPMLPLCHGHQGFACTCLQCFQIVCDLSLKNNTAQKERYGMVSLPEILDIAYSTVGLAPINTVAHYRLAASCGFPSIKGDIRPTADGGLVMCHDAGFTFDADGRIGRFDKQHYTPILSMRYADCLRLEYADTAPDGTHPHVASLEDFLRVSREAGKYAFITARNEEIPTVVAEMFRLIRQIGMEDRCIVNSFTYETLKETRRYSASVPVSHVQPHWAALTGDIVRAAADLGNALVCMFSYPDKDGKAAEAIQASAPAMELAQSLGMRLFQAAIPTAEERTACLDLGFSGFQLLHVFPPYAVPEKEVGQ